MEFSVKRIVFFLLIVLLLSSNLVISFQKCMSKNPLAKENSLQDSKTLVTQDGASKSQAINNLQLPMSMISIRNGENKSVNVFLGAQTNLTWIGIGSSTIIKPSPVAENKIDANLLNVTGLVMNGYIHDNQTNVIISFSDMAHLTMGSNGWSLPETPNRMFDETHIIYTSEEAFGSVRYLAGRLNYSTIFKLALNPAVDHIWLDREFHVCLDESVRIIKDPVKWASLESSFGRMISGSGIKIAILDTGIDSTHPDFSFPNGTSKIVSAVSFTGESTADGFGHGTHCASIAAGTGVASAGQYMGVAPGATLLNVKVLDNTGEGLESWIIGGIQWALDNGANILSMSFGTIFGGNGSDPLSTTVNWATSHGAVCVVAAGNYGSEMYTIGSPGAAQLAITVGASTKADFIATFSSRGPTIDYRIKPDVVAPGVDIIAARATGTNMGTPVSQYYTKASGTSMATPHVAGAAALLLDAHPSWGPAKVKNALANYARDIGGTVLDQGTGRIDVCKAANASAIGNFSITFGKVKLNTIIRRIFIIQNLANRTLSMALNAQAWHISDGTLYNAVSMNASSFILSSGATRKVELSLNTDGALLDGYFEGRVNVTFDGASFRIPFLFCILSQLSVETVDESGSKLMAAFAVINAQTGATEAYSSECAGAQFVLVQGLYVVQAMDVYALNPLGGLDMKISFLIHKKLSVGIGETVNLQLSLTSAYKLKVRSTDVQGSPLYVVCKRLLTPYYTIGYLSDVGTLTSQYIYLTNLAEYTKSPCFFGFEGFTEDYAHWTQVGILTSEVEAYFIGWDLSSLLPTQTALNYTNSQLATFNVETMLSMSSSVSTIWFDQIGGMWQTGFWHGYETHPGIVWKTHVLPYQYKLSPAADWSELQWSCLYCFSSKPYESAENYIIDRHFQPIAEGENTSYTLGKTPLLPQDIIDDPSYYGTGLYIPYYPLRVERNMFIAKTNPQATKRFEVYRNGLLMSNNTQPWAQTPIPISQFLNFYGYGLYSFKVKTETSLICSSQNVAEYEINYTSTNEDIIPPSITKIDCDSCFIDNEHHMGVQLADENTIHNVCVFYSADGRPYLPSEVRDLGNNAYSSSVTFAAGTQKISLIIEATDESGNKIRLEASPAAVRGHETRIGITPNDNRITGKLTIIGGSLPQQAYLKVKSDGKVAYVITDANGNFAFDAPQSLRLQMDMSSMGICHSASLVASFLTARTQPLAIAPISGGGWYVEGTDAILTAPEHVDVSSNTRYKFGYWDVDGTSRGSQVNPIAVNMNFSHVATAHYGAQYLVLFIQTGLTSDATNIIINVNGNTKSLSDLPFAFWVDSGSGVTYSYSSLVSSVVSNKRFRLNSITGPISPVTVSSPLTLTGNYVVQYSVVFGQTGLDSTATGTVAVINGEAKTYTAMSSIVWADSGSSITYVYSNIVLGSVTGKRFKLVGVVGPPSSFTVTGSATVMGNYKIQYYLTISEDPTDTASISGEGWYDEATTIVLTAPVAQNFNFAYWDIDGVTEGSGVNSVTVSMNRPHSATAHYASTLSGGSPLGRFALLSL
jgi:serine protease AprX